MLPKRDLLIVSNLRMNARQTLTKMSRSTKIPISTIYDRLKHHEKDLITKHTSLLNFSKLGYNTRALVLISVSKDHREDIKDYLCKCPYVNNLNKINNDFDFQIEVIFTQIREIEDFLEDLEERFRIKKRKVSYIIDEIKR